MSAFKNAFGSLQKLGKAVMLPVSVLPVAGILLGVGASGFSFIPKMVSDLMAKAGGAIFSALPMLFAIGVALGLAAGDGVAALAATVGFLVMVATLGVMADVRGLVPGSPQIADHAKEIARMLNIRPEEVEITIKHGLIDTGVFGGILVGAMAAYFFNKYYRIQLPPYLGFFAGKRFVPIVTSFGAIALGVVLSFLWPPVGAGINAFSNWAVHESTALAVFIYGFVERCLIPFGLHHIWNVPFYFEMGSYTVPSTGDVVHGDITRFMMGDPTAGILGGGYLFKMWGLPAAAMAIWHCARPERRVQVGGIMISAALTAFLTGITEPIEFSFMFVAPPLYLLHAFLAGTAETAFYLCGGLMGTSFSHGLIDFIILFGKATKPWLVPVLGILYAGIYYGAFLFCITHFDLKTPGREDASDDDAPTFVHGEEAFSRQLVLAFGGRKNITALDACITRLRVSVAEPKLASPAKLKALGASGVLSMGNSLQAIFGPQSENFKTDMQIYLQSAGDDADLSEEEKAELMAGGASAQPPGEAAAVVDPEAGRKAVAWVAALGGQSNIKELGACAHTRVRVKVADAARVDLAGLEAAGVQAVMPLPEGVYHLIVGPGNDAYLREMKRVA